MKLPIMSIVATLAATTSRRVAAFSKAPIGRITTARSMASSGPMPYDEDKMPIYALGVNIGMQISQQVRMQLFYYWLIALIAETQDVH